MKWVVVYLVTLLAMPMAEAPARGQESALDFSEERLVTEFRLTDDNAELLPGEPGVDLFWKIRRNEFGGKSFRMIGSRIKLPQMPAVELGPSASRRLLVLLGYSLRTLEVKSFEEWMKGQGDVTHRPSPAIALNTPSEFAPERFFRYELARLAREVLNGDGAGQVYFCYQDESGDFAILFRTAFASPVQVLGSHPYLRGEVEVIERIKTGGILYPASPFPAGMLGPAKSVRRVIGLGHEGIVWQSTQEEQVIVRLVRDGRAIVAWTLDMDRVQIPRSWTRNLGAPSIIATPYRLVGHAVVSPDTWFANGLAVDPEVFFEEWGAR